LYLSYLARVLRLFDNSLTGPAFEKITVSGEVDKMAKALQALSINHELAAEPLADGHRPDVPRVDLHPSQVTDDLAGG
jgi:hypothetical protein